MLKKNKDILFYCCWYVKRKVWKYKLLKKEHFADANQENNNEIIPLIFHPVF